MADDLKVKVVASVDQSSTAVTKFRNQLQQLADKASKGGAVPKIKISVDNSSIQNVKRELSALGKAVKSSGLAPAINLESLKQSSSEMDKMIAKMNDMIEKTVQLRSEQEKTRSQKATGQREPNPALNLKKQQDLMERAKGELANFEIFVKKMKPSAVRENASEINKYKTELEEIIATGMGDIPKTGIKSFQATQKQLGNANNNFLNALQSKMKSLSSYVIGSIFTYGAVDQLREGLRTIEDIDNALTNINMTMPVTASEMRQIGGKSIDMAKEMGTSVQNVLSVAQIYANETETIDNMLQKARPTILLSTASGMGGSESADTIQASLIQFDLAEDQAMHVSDVFQKVSANMKMEFKRGTQEIAEGIKTSGAIAKESGYNLEEYAATLGNIIETTRFGGSQVGNALKMVMARVGGAKDDDVTAEEVSKADAAYQQIGISVRDANGEFRKMPDILDDLSAKWENLNSVQRSYIAEASAGNRNRSVFLAMMNNYQRQVELTTQAIDAQGFSEETNGKRMQSLDAKLKQLKATMDGMWVNLLDSAVLKFFVDIGNTVAKLLSAGDGLGIKIALIVAAVPTLLSLLNAFKSSDIGQGFSKTFEDFNAFFKRYKEIRKDQKSSKTESKDGAVSSVGTGIGGILSAMGDAGLSKLGMVGMGISIATSIISIGKQISQAYQQHKQDIIDEGNAIIESYQKEDEAARSNITTLSGFKEEFMKLSAGVDAYGNNIALSANEYSRYQQIVSQVLNLTPALISGYDKEGNAIANKNNLIERSIDLLKQEQQLKLKEEVSDDNIKKILDGKKEEYRKADKFPKDKMLKAVDLFSYSNPTAMPGEGAEYEQKLAKALGLDEIEKDRINNSNMTVGQIALDHLDKIIPILQNSPDNLGGLIPEEQFKLLKNSVLEYQQALNKYNFNLESAAKALNPTLQIVPQTITAYDALSDAQKEFISGYIDGFKITGKTSESEVLNMKSDIEELVDKIAGNTDIQDRITKLFTIDKNNGIGNWSKEVNQQVDSIAQEFNLSNDQKKAILIKLGIKFTNDGKQMFPEAIEKIKQTVGEKWGAGFDFNLLTSEQLEFAYNNLDSLNTLSFDQFKQQAKDAAAHAQLIASSVETLSSKIDETQSAYDTIYSAMEQKDADSYLSIDSLQSLLGLSDEYLSCLVDENGQLSLNADSYNQLAKAQLESLRAKQIGDLNDWIAQMKEEKKSVSDLADEWERNAGARQLASGAELVDPGEYGNTDQYKAKIAQIQATEQAIAGMDVGLGGQSSAAKKAEQERQKALEERNQAQEDYNKKVEETNEKLTELDEKDHLEALKHRLEQMAMLIEQFNLITELLDLKLELTDESDYSTRGDIMLEQYDTLIERGQKLKEQFEEQASIVPQNADEANELANSLSDLGDQIRDNVREVVDLNHELNMLQINAITASADNTVKKLESMSSIMDYNRQVLTEGSMFGSGMAFNLDMLLPTIPLSALEKQRSENDSLIAEQQYYEDTISQIKREALEQQYQENIAAREKERQQLIADLDAAKATLDEKLAELTGSVNTAADTAQVKVETTSDQVKNNVETTSQSATQSVQNAATNISNIVFEAPKLGESWTAWLEEIESKVNAAKNSVNSFNSTLANGGRSDIVNFALNELGQGGPGTNKPNKYNNYTEQAWCGYFVDYVLKEAGVTDIPSQVSVKQGIAGMREKGKFRSPSGYTPAPGDLIYFDWESDGISDHVGFVESCDGTYVYTVEGNTGAGVKQRKYPINSKQIYGYGITGYATGGTVSKNTTILAGERRRELAITPDGKSYILGEHGAGLYDVPEGTKIISNPETEQILRFTGTKINGQQIPKLADGNLDFSSEEALRKSFRDLTTQMLFPENFYTDFAKENQEYTDKRNHAMEMINRMKKSFVSGKNDAEFVDAMVKLIDSQLQTDKNYTYQIQKSYIEQAGSYLKSELEKAQTDYQNALASGMDVSVLRAYQEGISALTDKIVQLDTQWIQLNKDIRDFKVAQAELKQKPFEDSVLAQTKNIEYQQRILEQTTDYVARQSGLEEMLRLYTKLQDEARLAQDTAHQTANSLFEDYADVLAPFNRDRVDRWFDANGEFSAQFEKDLRLLPDDVSGGMKERLKDFAALLQIEKKQWLSMQDTVLNSEDKLRDLRKQRQQEQLDAYNTLYDTVMEMIERNYDEEKKMYDKAHETRMKQIEEQKTAIEDIYKRQMDLLDEVKDREDYQRELSDEQGKADKLRARIDILSLDTSESARLERLQLEKDLREQEEKIAQMQRDHEYEQTKEALQKDLEAQQAHMDRLSEEEDAYSAYLSEQLEERYSEQNKAAIATEALATGTLNVISAKGIQTYDDILAHGQGAAMSLVVAYDKLATESGKKFSGMGIEFENIINMMREAVDLSDRLANSGTIRDIMGDNAFTGNTDVSSSTGLNHPQNNVHDITNWGMGNEGDTSLTGMTYEQNEAKLRSDAAYREAEVKRAAGVLRNRLAAGRTDNESQISYLQFVVGLIRENRDQMIYSLPSILSGLPVYHTGRAGINSKEDLAVILNTESVLKEDTISKMARMAQALKTGMFSTALLQRFTPNTHFERVVSAVDVGGVTINISGNATPDTVMALRKEGENLLQQIGRSVRNRTGV